MRRFLALLIVATLTACSAVNVATAPVDVTTLAKSAYTAKATYAGLLTVAVAYNSRPRCGAPTSPILCSDAAIVDQLRKASAAADAATQAAENAVRNLGANTTVIQAAVAAAEQAVSALRAITDAYAPAK